MRGATIRTDAHVTVKDVPAFVRGIERAAGRVSAGMRAIEAQPATFGKSSYRLGYFSVLMTGTITWPSRKTTFSTEANSGSARRASATLNEGSGFHFAPSLTSDSAARSSRSLSGRCQLPRASGLCAPTMPLVSVVRRLPCSARNLSSLCNLSALGWAKGSVRVRRNYPVMLSRNNSPVFA